MGPRHLPQPMLRGTPERPASPVRPYLPGCTPAAASPVHRTYDITSGRQMLAVTVQLCTITAMASEGHSCCFWLQVPSWPPSQQQRTLSCQSALLLLLYTGQTEYYEACCCWFSSQDIGNNQAGCCFSCLQDRWHRNRPAAAGHRNHAAFVHIGKRALRNQWNVRLKCEDVAPVRLKWVLLELPADEQYPWLPPD